MKPVEFLTLQEIIYINRLQISRFGGLYGIRDLALLESAAYTPQAMFNGQLLHPLIVDQAAAYLYHIVKNHPFVDGNKRTGAVTALLFLEKNNHTCPWTNEELFTITVSVADSTISKEMLTELFKSTYNTHMLY